MTGQTEFRTATMAKIYADQGHLEKAAEIYRHLLTEAPDRGDIREALAAVEARAHAQREKQLSDLVPLLEEWVGLLFKQRRLRQLNRAGKRIPRRPA